MPEIPLHHLSVGSTARIQNFHGSKNLSTKLRQYGLFIGDQVRLLRMAPFKGPILIEVNGREIALGYGIAAKIMVEPL